MMIFYIIASLYNFITSNYDISGQITYSIISDKMAVSDIQIKVNNSIWDSYQVDIYNKSAVFLCVDRSGSMGTLLGQQKRIDVVKDQILSFAKTFFTKDLTKNVTLYVTFYDDEVDTQGFTDYQSLQAYMNDKSTPGGDTGFYLALQDVLSKVKENNLQNIHVYLLSDGQDSYPDDTQKVMKSLHTYLTQNSIHSRFSAIGIAQPDTQTMSEIINLGTISGDYVYVDESKSSDTQIQQINQFYDLINTYVFNQPKGITLTILDETIFLKLFKDGATQTHQVFLLTGHIFNLQDIKTYLGKLKGILEDKSYHYSNISLVKKNIGYDDNKDLLVIYNSVVQLNFDLTRQIVKADIDDIQAQINGNLKDSLKQDIKKDYQYIDSQLKNMEIVINNNQDKNLNVKERGSVEQYRNFVLKRFEDRQLEVFDASSPDEKDDLDDGTGDSDTKTDTKAMRVVIGIKHIFEVIITITIFLFYAIRCKCSFIKFRICCIYVFVAYIVLLVQDFILMAPPIWIFIYHVALLMIIFVVSLRKKDPSQEGNDRTDSLQRVSLNPNNYVQINEQNEEVEVREDDQANAAANKKPGVVFSKTYREEFLKSSSLTKIAFMAFLFMELTLSICIIALALQ
ncbi:UNKNOWN [Stylonychia lemnae]|uniref:VWFA domain-containing protein n=1 Tax=Stylonychia lemnae TaxID=5949 RepID=A0A077ZS96_STYLE|nr:UNKNOWN [Stylonychia lemnae]|eukprot:CDW72768.1 UNKNOWN [Stylonychia lemnae]